MPSVYKVEILNHLVDQYEEAQRRLRGAETWLKSCVEDEREVWDEYERIEDAKRSTHPWIHRRIQEANGNRHTAESERNVAKEREQQAMRTLCDVVLLLAKGTQPPRSHVEPSDVGDAWYAANADHRGRVR